MEAISVRREGSACMTHGAGWRCGRVGMPFLVTDQRVDCLFLTMDAVTQNCLTSVREAESVLSFWLRAPGWACRCTGP